MHHLRLTISTRGCQINTSQKHISLRLCLRELPPPHHSFNQGSSTTGGLLHLPQNCIPVPWRGFDREKSRIPKMPTLVNVMSLRYKIHGMAAKECVSQTPNSKVSNFDCDGQKI